MNLPDLISIGELEVASDASEGDASEGDASEGDASGQPAQATQH